MRIPFEGVDRTTSAVSSSQVHRRSRARAPAGSARASAAPRSSAPAARWTTSTRRQVSRSESTDGLGSLSATSTSARSSVIGVRSSCEALATNRRCDSNAASSRPSSPSNVSPSSLSSSSGPSSASRSCRLSLGDPPGARAHRPHRTQRPPGHQPAEPDRDDRHDRQRDPRARQQRVELRGLTCVQGGRWRSSAGPSSCCLWAAVRRRKLASTWPAYACTRTRVVGPADVCSETTGASVGERGRPGGGAGAKAGRRRKRDSGPRLLADHDRLGGVRGPWATSP